MDNRPKQPDVADLADQLDLRFDNITLLQQALTHRSFVNEVADSGDDNERLEFLGDAVLDFVVGSYLFRHLPNEPEGMLTALRAALVRGRTLAQFARQLNIDRYLRLGYGEEESGGRSKMPTLAAAFEAVIGAIYLDCGLEAARDLVETLIAPTLPQIRSQRLHRDAKSEFQMWAQAQYGITPHYELVSESGPDHDKRFTVAILIGEEPWGEGEGRNKRQAEQAAARVALDAALAAVGE